MPPAQRARWEGCAKIPPEGSAGTQTPQTPFYGVWGASGPRCASARPSSCSATCWRAVRPARRRLVRARRRQFPSSFRNGSIAISGCPENRLQAPPPQQRAARERSGIDGTFDAYAGASSLLAACRYNQHQGGLQRLQLSRGFAKSLATRLIDRSLPHGESPSGIRTRLCSF